MRPPGKRVLVALLVVFSPGIAFALFQLFVFKGPVQERAQLMAGAFLAIGLVCVICLLFLLARDAVRRVRGRRSDG